MYETTSILPLWEPKYRTQRKVSYKKKFTDKTCFYQHQTNNDIKERMVYMQMVYLLQTVIIHKYVSAYQCKRLGPEETGIVPEQKYWLK